MTCALSRNGGLGIILFLNAKGYYNEYSKPMVLITFHNFSLDGAETHAILFLFWFTLCYLPEIETFLVESYREASLISLHSNNSSLEGALELKFVPFCSS